MSPEGAVFVRVCGPVSPDRARSLYARLEAQLIARDPACVACRVTGAADLSVVDVLARIALLAGRRRAALRITSSCTGLEQLVALAGLAGIITIELERGGQPETREEGGVEEVVDVDDPPT